jgi:MFS family permease
LLARTLVSITHRYTRPERAVPLTQSAAGFFLVGRFAALMISGGFTENLRWRWMFAVPVMLMAGKT